MIYSSTRSLTSWIFVAMHVVIYLVLIVSMLGVQAKRKRPHICFFLADDLGWNDVSFHGSRQIPTPNIDLLAANSVVLNNYYTQPICTPSRAALLTGWHPIHLGLQHYVLLSAQNAGMPLDVELLPEHLKKLGYSTHAIGKWHLGFLKKEYTPVYRGFDSHLGYWTGSMDYYDHTNYETYHNLSLKFGWGKVLRSNMRPADEFYGKYSTDVFTDRAVHIIKNHNPSKPLFLYMAHQAVHSANSYNLFQAPLDYVRKFRHINDPNRRVYAAMIWALDKSVGKLTKALHKKGMLDDVIFVFSTDNGGEGAGFLGGVASNWPLRGIKVTLWEGGVRGAAFIWSPRLKHRRRISNQLMQITDWLPTLYRAAGGNPKKLGDIYGQDLWESLSHNKPSPRKELLHNIDPVDNASSLRMGDYKLIIGSHLGAEYDRWYGPSGRNNGISDSKYRNFLDSSDVSKVLKKRKELTRVTSSWLSQLDIHCPSKNSTNIFDCEPTSAPCLFNIKDDPCEQNNLASKYPQIVERMMARLRQYNDSAVPIVNQTIDLRADPRYHRNYWTTWAQRL